MGAVFTLRKRRGGRLSGARGDHLPPPRLRRSSPEGGRASRFRLRPLWGRTGREAVRWGQVTESSLRYPSFTSIFPRFSPLKSLMKASGARSTPSSTVSFHLIWPAPIQPAMSLRNCGARS